MDSPSIEVIRLVIELVVGLLVTPFALVLWWMLRKLVADVVALEKTVQERDTAAREREAAHDKNLAEYKLHVSETFSTKNDLGKAMEQLVRSVDAVFNKLERIEDKLDSKADKAHA